MLVCAGDTQVVCEELQVLIDTDTLACADDLGAARGVDQGFDKGARIALDINPLA